VLRIDHVVYACADLDATADRFRRDHGLDSAEGGRHASWGTANRIVPLGEQYLELIAVVAEDDARATVFGGALLDRLADGDGWFLAVLATDDVGSVAARLGMDVVEGSRRRPDGTEVRWRMTGLEDPKRDPWLPFFIEWDVAPELHPGAARAGHGVRVEGIARVEIGGDPDRLRAWVGEDLPFAIVDGGPGIRRVVLATADGEPAIA